MTTSQQHLSSLTPAQIDQLWIEALAPAHKLFDRANGVAVQAERYRKAGSSYAKQAERYSQQAHELRVQAHNLRTEVEPPFKAEWDARGGWTRAYIVPGGHIHKSTSCHTLHITTLVAWLPEQSGWDEAKIVEAAGVNACTVCYPSAPVEALRAAELAAKKATQCPGSGTWDHDSSGLQYHQRRARCNHCGQTISATSTGKLRAHKPKAAA